jgi:hypothetical protein
VTLIVTVLAYAVAVLAIFLSVEGGVWGVE